MSAAPGSEPHGTAAGAERRGAVPVRKQRHGVPGVVRQLVPFALAASVVPLSGLIGHGVMNGRAFAVGILLTVLVLPAVVVIQVRRMPGWFRWTTMVATFAMLALTVQAVGGADSGALVVLLLPVVWMALYERRTQVVVALVLESAASVALHAADPVTPFSAEDLRRIVVFLAVSSLTAWAIARLVAQLARSERSARKGQQTLAAIAAAARAIRESDDARTTACEAAMEVSGASSVFLLESDDAEHLVITASTGTPLEPVRLDLAEPSASVVAYRSGAPLYVADVEGDARVSPRLRGLTGARSLLAQPFSHGGRVRGVVVVSWLEPHPESAAETRSTLALLAEEFGSALERMDLNAALEHRATTDPLTGMANRRVWREELPRMMTDAGPLCVALLDLDYFKTYNDTHGHLAGDTVLASLGRSWLSMLRPQDLLVRWGGEEFALALPDCPVDCALEVLERLRAQVPDGQAASAGLACWDGVETIEVLMSRADAALYEAKRTGRNRTVRSVAGPDGVDRGEPAAVR
ncbi:MAG TPA: GGDEF domain-containing protein [Cellulomonadaceae bacterium]|nr:GGDEF domain-containing protein [Cellulomonadaceae bacterium]